MYKVLFMERWLQTASPKPKFQAQHALTAACCAAAMLTAGGAVRAHGLTPAIVSVLSMNASGASIVGITAGAAVRTSFGYRYVCPDAWDGTIPAPFAAVPGRPALVASGSGVFVVNEDGSVVL